MFKIIQLNRILEIDFNKSYYKVAVTKRISYLQMLSGLYR